MVHPTQILKQVFDSNVLSLISNLVYENISNLSDEEIVKASHGNYFPLGDHASQLILSRLPLLDNEIGNPTLLRHSTVTGPHTDHNHDNGKHAVLRTFVIPLKTLNTYTITFNEFMPVGSIGKNLIDYVSNLPDVNMIGQNEIKKYFSISKKQYWISKLSIETVFKWIAGDVLIFDRRRIHTGDDHIGKCEKEGLVIWTRTK